MAQDEAIIATSFEWLPDEEGIKTKTTPCSTSNTWFEWLPDEEGIKTTYIRQDLGLL